MILKKGDLLKHERSLDCAVRVWADPLIQEDGRIIIHVGWYNLGFNHTFFTNTPTQDITIHPDQLSSWLILVDPDFRWEPVFRPCSRSYRNAKWEKLALEPQAKKS